jgi:hypothetical protein
MFDDFTMNPQWSFLGYTPAATYSLEVREGWLYLEPYGGSNTVIQNDAEHNYSLITRVDFEPQSTDDEAGLRIINGPETHEVKVFSTKNSDGNAALVFSFGATEYEVENTIGSVVWLKLTRSDHVMSAFYSPDGNNWQQIGENIDALAIDVQQTDFNDFTGNQQGLYVKGNYAFFDLYIYRDAYTPISAKSPANQNGTSVVYSRAGSGVLSSIDNGDWAMFAGVEFGNKDYKKYPAGFEIYASSATDGGIVEVWIDSIDTGKKIAACSVENTGDWSNFKMFRAEVDSITGNHDVYLRFSGSETDRLFQINWFRFLSKYDLPTSLGDFSNESLKIEKFQLYQNYPNPFNPHTRINFTLPRSGTVELDLFNTLGEKIMTIAKGEYSAGTHRVDFLAENLASGIYYYRLKAGRYSQMKKMIFLK